MSVQKSQPLTRQAIDAYLAEDAYHQYMHNPDAEYNLDSHNSDRARNYALQKKLIQVYMETFKMNANEAEAEVKREMADKYTPNRYDMPATKQRKQHRSAKKGVIDKERGGLQRSKGTEYSEEQWDLFERSLK